MTTIYELIREAVEAKGAVEKTASRAFNRGEAENVSQGLMKIASYPYKEEAYQSTCEIMKVASNTLSEALAELDAVRSKNGELEKVAEVRHIIEQMIESGVIDKYDAQEKVAELLEKSDEDLKIVKEAMKLTGGKAENMFFATEKTASIKTEKPGMFDGVVE